MTELCLVTRIYTLTLLMTFSLVTFKGHSDVSVSSVFIRFIIYNGINEIIY